MDDKKQAREQFQKADQLFRDKDFAAALVVLDELDQQFPDTKNVIYPRAMCLARVGRYEEALDLCRQLKVEFGDARGERLIAKINDLRKARLEKEKEKQKEPKTTAHSVPVSGIYTLDSNPPPQGQHPKGKNLEFSPEFNPSAAGPGQSNDDSLLGGLDTLELGDGSPAIDMAALDDLFAAKPPASPPPVKPEPPSRTKIYVGAGIAAAVLAILVALPLVLGGGGGSSESPAPAQTQGAAPAEPGTAEAPQYDGPPINWLSSMEEASNAADEDGRDILLVFYSSSTPSPDLDLMDTAVWSDPTIRYFAKNWVCAKIDVDAEPETKDMWEITRLPTTILTDSWFEGEYYRQEGFVDAAEFYTAMMEYDLAPLESDYELPKMPAGALAMLPILYVLATFFPVLFTLMILGRMPEDDLVTGLLGMLLVGIVAPFLGVFVMRVVYGLTRMETLLYYGLFLAHLIVFDLIMTFISNLGMPFHVYLYALADRM